MIEAAGRKNIYDRLIAGELLETLGAEAPPFDLILAADVFVYLPDLKPVLVAASKKLASSGYFAFTLETHDGGGAILRETLRFAHGKTHLREAAQAAGLEILLLEEVSTRREKNLPVEGLLVLLGPRGGHSSSAE